MFNAEEGGCSLASNINAATRQAVIHEFNGMNHRQLAQKYPITVRDIYRILTADYLVRALKTALSSLIDQGLHRYLSGSQLHALVRLLNELGETDVAQRLQCMYLSGPQSCEDARGHPDKAPKSRPALEILGLQACLQWLTLEWRRVRS